MVWAKIISTRLFAVYGVKREKGEKGEKGGLNFPQKRASIFFAICGLNVGFGLVLLAYGP